MVWCGVGFLPIIIPHQPSCIVLFCVVGWVVAIQKLVGVWHCHTVKKQTNELVGFYFQYFLDLIM